MVQVPDDWPDDELIDGLSNDAWALHMSALCFTARRVSDGRVPDRAVHRLRLVADVDGCVDELVDVGLWQRVDTGFHIETWHDHVLSRDEITKIRAQNRERQERKRRHDRGDHSICERCWYVRKYGSHGVTDDVTNPVSDGVINAPLLDSTRLDSNGSERESSEGEGCEPSATAPGSHPRGRATGSGMLKTLDAAALDELPWRDVGTGCPHDSSGWQWLAETDHRVAGPRCDTCRELISHTGSDAGSLMRTAMRSGYLFGFNDPPTWLALFEADRAATSAALCLASLIGVNVGGDAATPESVEAVAAEIIRKHRDQPLDRVRHLLERKNQA